MRKTTLFFFINLTTILNTLSQNVKLGSTLGSTLGSKLSSGKTFEERLKEEDLEGYEEDHSMEEQIKELIKEYIQDQDWTPEQQINKETFKKMFVSLIQRGALRGGNSEVLKKLADKILEKHGEPIIVKNLEQYFNIEELTLTYSKMFSFTGDL